MPTKSLFLPVQGQGFDKFADNNVNQQGNSGDALGNYLQRRRSYFDRLAIRLHPFTTPAGVFGTDMFDDLVFSRFYV